MKLRAMVLAVGLLLLGAAMAANAEAATSIEGVWSFNGGEVAIQALPDGTYEGTVVEPTKFSQCYHPVGEAVWTHITPQSDGSYWGDHHWYFATSACVPNPQLGLTAWRVLDGADGTHFLRVCLSEPGSTSQPMIDPAGVASGDTYGCEDSALVSALPGKPSLTFPSSKKCLKSPRLVGYATPATGDPLTQVKVRLRSGKLHRQARLRTRKNGTVVARLKLWHLPKQSFTMVAGVTTVLGNEVSLKRRYHVCAPPGRG